MAKKGLRHGYNRTGLILPILDPMVLFLNVVVQVKKKEETILNVCHWQKQEL